MEDEQGGVLCTSTRLHDTGLRSLNLEIMQLPDFLVSAVTLSCKP